jgi:formylglycine-generating enzyme required for sulfatase activity
MLRLIALTFALLLAMPAAAQAPGTVVKDCLECPIVTFDDLLPPGTVVKDCPECPEMVVLPVGYTRLASGGNVRIEKPFPVGKYEVTFEEYDACVRAGACACCPDDRGWGRGRQPVIDVSWHDAQDYVAWLSKRTGKAYRLLSEAEWEYAAQAGTGREAKVTPGAGEANCDGCGSHWDSKQTAPVGSFAANAFGLHDMLGNVWEWTDPKRSCGDNPFDRFGPYVIRGGSWIYDPPFARSAYRNGLNPDFREGNIGFRVARTP